MGFVEATRTCLRKYATFSGRASRSEYWWFFLAVILASGVASLLDVLLFGPLVTETTEVVIDAQGAESTVTRTNTDYGSGPISAIVGLALFVPAFAAAFRRLHDVGKPGWIAAAPVIVNIVGVALGFLLFAVGAAPLTGIVSLAAIAVSFGFGIWLLILLVRPSEPAQNAFGPPPSS